MPTYATVKQLEALKQRLEAEEGRRNAGDQALADRLSAVEARLTALEGDPEPPAPEPPASDLILALDGGNYGPSGAADIAGCVDHVRADVSRGAGMVSNFKAAGLKITMLFPGDYSSAGVAGISADAWVAQTLSFYRANVTPAQAPIVEVLNEPGGTWFWGSEATSQRSADAYRELLRKTHAAFHAEYGSAAPKILGSVDGTSNLTFGQRWWRPECAGFVDGVTVHPYGGTGSVSSSALGNRARVEEAHSLTGLPVYITEVGWPTAVGQPSTGDSLQWSEAAQATNIRNFIEWARTKDYIRQVVIFQHRDHGTNSWYGVVRGSDGSHKPAYDVLRQL